MNTNDRRTAIRQVQEGYRFGWFGLLVVTLVAAAIVAALIVAWALG